MIKINPLRLFLLVALILLAGDIFAAEKEGPTTLILVRHAEKAVDGSTDPPLSPEGERRADELALVLDLMDIRAVYSTPYQRTRRTAAPTADKKGLRIREYKPGHEMAFIQQVIAAHRGETVLVVGHSNTVPKLANAAAGKEKYGDLEDSVYDNLFIAVFPASGPAAICRLRFWPHTIN